jgi:hypothetical protein
MISGIEIVVCASTEYHVKKQIVHFQAIF